MNIPNDISHRQGPVSHLRAATPDTAGASPVAPPSPPTNPPERAEGNKAGAEINERRLRSYARPATEKLHWFKMEEVFLKSALPARDGFVLDDTSLALPAQPTARSSTKAGLNERSLRVQQQVQLTLARRARKTVSNGNSFWFQ